MCHIIFDLSPSLGRRSLPINLVYGESCSDTSSAAKLARLLCLCLKALSLDSVPRVFLVSRSISKEPPNISRTEGKARCLQSCAPASTSWQMDVELLRAKHLVKLQTMRGLWILFIQQRRWYLPSKSSYGPFLENCWCACKAPQLLNAAHSLLYIWSTHFFMMANLFFSFFFLLSTHWDCGQTRSVHRDVTFRNRRWQNRFFILF